MATDTAEPVSEVADSGGVDIRWTVEPDPPRRWMGPPIRLRFVNKASAAPDVVIFGADTVINQDGAAVAWTVIRKCGPGWSRPFVYDRMPTIGSTDPFGNYSPQLPASMGQAFALRSGDAGVELVEAGASTERTMTQFSNELSMPGAVDVLIYRDGKPFAKHVGLLPQQTTFFKRPSSIWIGVVEEVEQGDVMPAATVSRITTEIMLGNLVSADLVMTGGEEDPYAFALENARDV